MNAPEAIEALIEQFQKAGLRELHVRCDEFEIHLSTDAEQAGIASTVQLHVEFNKPGASEGVGKVRTPLSTAPRSAPAEPPKTAPAQVQYPSGAVLVRAPYLGTFYRAPKPGAQPFVEVGAQVTAETELCMIEVMKLFTAVRAGSKGTVHAILAEDGQMVQTDQPLLVLVPST